MNKVLKLELENENYSAVIVRVNHLNDYNLRTLAGFPIFGTQALINKNTEIGTLGIYFPTECKLSYDFCSNNNLYRDSSLNKDETKTGFFEPSGRVKAIRLQKQTSNAFFVELSSLSYLGIDVSEFKEGDKFTHINGIEICRKYVIRETGSSKNKTRGLTKKFTRIDSKTFPEHFDTDQYFRNVERYKDNTFITVTVKLHGTSGRFANARVRKLGKMEKFIHTCDARVLHFLNKKSRFKKIRKFKKLLHDTYFNWVSLSLNKIPFEKKYEYDTLAGSRRVIKDTKTAKLNEDYYDCDVWNLHLSRIRHIIPKNWIIYGEIIGWVDETKPIQKNYTYGLPNGSSELYVYRIAIVNEDGILQDLHWEQVKSWCVDNAVKHVPEIWDGYHRDFRVEEFMDKRYADIGFKTLPLDNKDVVYEGICIRTDNLNPYVTKAKSPLFYEHETKLLDSGEEDLESQQSGEENESKDDY
jgi:hypothetical protein